MTVTHGWYRVAPGVLPAAMMCFAVAACGRGEAGNADSADTAQLTMAVPTAATTPTARKTPSLKEATGESGAVDAASPDVARRYRDSLDFTGYSKDAQLERGHGTGVFVSVRLIPEAGSHLLAPNHFQTGGHIAYAVVLTDASNNLPEIGLLQPNDTAFLWVDEGLTGNNPDRYRARYMVPRSDGGLSPRGEPMRMVTVEHSSRPPDPGAPDIIVDRDSISDVHRQLHDSVRRVLWQAPESARVHKHLTVCFACQIGWCQVEQG